MEYEPVIGLEVHAQLKTASKIFCSCPNEFGAAPNSQVCPICLGMPGSLPRLNRQAVEYIIRLGLATNCAIAEQSVMARKNYFYPDLPKGYQISQFEAPVAEKGWLEVEIDGQTSRIGITRCHLEEDAGKLIHDEHAPVSQVDLNRCGTPLIEIVSEPDIRSPRQAEAYMRQLRELVRYLDICDGNMEEGSLRCDANISLRPKGQEEFGTRAEIKNMNSFKGVRRGLEFEIRRQTAVLQSGGQVVQETRLWDADKGETFSMRGKEEAHDYRYFPDPDLVPIRPGEDWVADIRAALPELPQAKRVRLAQEYGLPEYDIGVLTEDRQVADYFEAAAKESGNAKSASNWIMTEVLGRLHEVGGDFPVGAEALGRLIKLIDGQVISGKMAKEVFEEMAQTGAEAEAIVDQRGLKQISDTGELEALIDRIMADNPDNVEKYRAGKTKVLGFFVGQVMKETKGQANPQVVNQILVNKLSG